MPTFDDSSVGDAAQSSTGMSRRSVVRASVWSVPVVAIAAAAPAFAGSLDGQVTWTGNTAATHAANSTTVTFTRTLSNAGAFPTNGLQLTFTLTSNNANAQKTWAGSTMPAPVGWTIFSGPTNVGQGTRWVLTGTVPAKTVTNGLLAFTPVVTIPSGGKGETGVATLSATANNFVGTVQTTVNIP